VVSDKRPLFDGVGWKIFNKIFTVNVIADGLGHILNVEKATCHECTNGWQERNG
jgi:hypothetical protein